MENSKLPLPANIELLERRYHLSGAASPLAHSTGVLSQGTGSGTAVTVGNVALFAGGGVILNPALVKTTIDQYSQTTGLWSAEPLPVSVRPGSASAAVGGVALFPNIGYIRPAGSRGYRVDIFNARTGRWSKTKSPDFRSESTLGLSLGNTALFVGATTADVYHADTRSWTRKPLPVATEAPHGVVAGGKAYVTTDQAKVVDVYDGSTHRWSTITAPVEAVGGPVVSVGTKVMLRGGLSDGEVVLVIYDTAAATWSTVPIPDTSFFDAGGSVGSKAIFAGGGSSGSLVEIYDLATGQWSADHLAVGRSAMAVTTVGTQSLFAGGDLNAGGPDSSAVVDVFTDGSPVPVLSGSVAGGIGRQDRVTVTNSGDADVAAGYTVQIYASADRTLNGAILVGSRTVATALAAGASATFDVRTAIRAGMPGGTYHLVAAVRDGAGVVTAVAAEEGTFRV